MRLKCHHPTTGILGREYGKHADVCADIKKAIIGRKSFDPVIGRWFEILQGVDKIDVFLIGNREGNLGSIEHHLGIWNIFRIVDGLFKSRRISNRDYIRFPE